MLFPLVELFGLRFDDAEGQADRCQFLATVRGIRGVLLQFSPDLVSARQPLLGERQAILLDAEHRGIHGTVAKEL